MSPLLQRARTPFELMVASWPVQPGGAFGESTIIVQAPSLPAVADPSAALPNALEPGGRGRAPQGTSWERAALCRALVESRHLGSCPQDTAGSYCAVSTITDGADPRGLTADKSLVCIVSSGRIDRATRASGRLSSATWLRAVRCILALPACIAGLCTHRSRLGTICFFDNLLCVFTANKAASGYMIKLQFANLVFPLLKCHPSHLCTGFYPSIGCELRVT